jgi:hypothetical protein
MSKAERKKAASAIYYAADGSVVRRVDFQEEQKSATIIAAAKMWL